MKIELIRQKFNETRGYKYKPFDYCCDKIKDNPRIIFDDVELDEKWDEDDYECTFPAFVIHHSETVHSWEDEWENDYYYKIDFCPFCGKLIEISIIDEEDVDEIYQSLSKQREELWKKYTRTDSKKKADALREQVRELDNQINWFYHLCEYKDVSENNP